MRMDYQVIWQSRWMICSKYTRLIYSNSYLAIFLKKTWLAISIRATGQTSEKKTAELQNNVTINGITRKLRNFNSQGTKTLYQNNLNNIAIFFTFSRGLLKLSVLTPNFTRIVKTQVKFQKFNI